MIKKIIFLVIKKIIYNKEITILILIKLKGKQIKVIVIIFKVRI